MGNKAYKAVVIGLGSMGFGAAVSLVRAGIYTVGVDLREDALQAFRGAGGEACDQLDNALSKADVVFLFVVNAQQVEGILFKDAHTLADCSPGTVFCLCPTMAPESTLSIAQRLQEQGMLVLDAPVSGGSVKALDGKMTIMASGSPESFTAAQPALDAIAEKVFNLGADIGIGSKVKMINQLLAGVHIAAAAEAMALAAKQGLDLGRVYEVITQAAGNSWMFENRGAHIRDGDYTPHSMVDIFVKDLGIIEQATPDFPTPQAETALRLFREAAEAGLGSEDDSAVAKVLAERGGVRLPGMND